MNHVSYDFSDTAVLVTGGTSGIGHAIATTFAAAGAHVTVTGTRAAPADYDVALDRFDHRRLDTTEPASIDALVDALGRLDVLVNNAGANFPGGRDEWEPELQRAALDDSRAFVESAATLESGLGVLKRRAWLASPTRSRMACTRAFLDAESKLRRRNA